MKRLICSAALAAAFGGAWATDIAWTGYGNGNSSLGFTISNGSTTESGVYAGSLLLSVGTAPSVQALEAYCTTPFTWLHSPWTADLTQNVGVSDDIARIAGVTVSGDQSLGAAVQLAIWDKVAGAGFTWSTSEPNATTIRGYYNQLVAGTFAGLSKDVPNYSFWKADPTGSSQDMITIDKGFHGPKNPTPEPVTMALSAAGLGLAALRRRRTAR